MKVVVLLLITSLASLADTVTPPIAPLEERPWLGADFWANPLEDWELNGGRLTNRFSGGSRSVVVLTAELSTASEPFTIRTDIEQVSFETRGQGYVGFEIGRRTPQDDYRDSAVAGAGLPVGIRLDGRLMIGSAMSTEATVPMPMPRIQLELRGEPQEDGLFQCTLRASDASGRILARLSQPVHETHLQGLVALMTTTRLPQRIDPASPRPADLSPIAQDRGDEARFAFSNVSLTGDRVKARPERAFGPIMWTTYTLDNDGVLRLLMQGAPFNRKVNLEAILRIPGREPLRASFEPNSRTALFRVRKVATTEDTPFTIEFAGGTWSGTVRALPSSGPVKVAALSCNDGTGFPHADLVDNVAAHEPDLITFLGDQIYEKIGGYGTIYDRRPNDRSVLSYLRKYALHGWTWREMLRDHPSITIPDDHDVFHGNLWGEEGEPADTTTGYGMEAENSGGYKMSPEMVNVVHRTQAGSLPEPRDRASCRSGISVYFTRYAFGPIDMVILADRQFKSAPAKLLPIAEIENGWPGNPRWDPATQSDHPEAQLLGPRQESFLRQWQTHPAAGTSFRVALSQSPWSAVQTLPVDARSDRVVRSLPILKPGEYAKNDEPKPDLDTNGWPSRARNVALEILAEAQAIHITGDQHLGTTGQYGIETWRDGPWWIATPAIANTWPRRWMPATEGKNRRPDDPKWLGDFRDAFGNHLTLHAVANPQDVDREPGRLFDRAVGYTLVTFRPDSGQVELANWPYWASPAKSAPDDQPYPGWPIVINPSTGRRIR